MAIIAQIIENGEAIEVTSAIAICRDPKDNMFLNLALDGKANAIISRDPDLLELHPFRNIPILSPVAFLDWLKVEIK